MVGGQMGLIMCVTLRCNADCDYCFEFKNGDTMSRERLETIVGRVLDYVDEKGVSDITIYWTGGDIFTVQPDLLLSAHDLLCDFAARTNTVIRNRMTTNLIGYHKRWNDVIRHMFGNSVASSLDYPNLHRRTRGGTPEAFTKLWLRKLEEVRDQDIRVATISVLNRQTFRMGAERYYHYVVHELGLFDFRAKLPFPGGFANTCKDGFPLDTTANAAFHADLIDVWWEDGLAQRVRLSPFVELMDYFNQAQESLPCIWQDCCANHFFGIDPNGFVTQCDGWMGTMTDLRFGNILENPNLSEIMAGNVRRRVRDRPVRLVQETDCIDCRYLAICHGGCPVHAYSLGEGLYRKDPYCGTYKTIFSYMEKKCLNRSAMGGQTAACGYGA